MAVFVIWLVLLVVIIANRWITALWIFFFGSALLVIAMATANTKKKQGAKAGKAVPRIDRIHYMDPDDHECPVCKARFRKDVMRCPKCGTAFTGKIKDDTEFDEEMELFEEDD